MRPSTSPSRGVAVAGLGVASSILIIASMLFGADPASAKSSDLSAVAIGDSVMLGARWELQKRGVNKVDAKVSRQASTGPDLVRKLAANPEIKYVVVHLGTNGTYSVDTCKEIVKAAGQHRTVFLINLKVPRPWEKLNNRLMSKCASAFDANRVRLVDWNEASQATSGLLYSDGMHLTPRGAKKFARMIVTAIKQTITLQGPSMVGHL